MAEQTRNVTEEEKRRRETILNYFKDQMSAARSQNEQMMNVMANNMIRLVMNPDLQTTDLPPITSGNISVMSTSGNENVNTTSEETMRVMTNPSTGERTAVPVTRDETSEPIQVSQIEVSPVIRTNRTVVTSEITNLVSSVSARMSATHISDTARNINDAEVQRGLEFAEQFAEHTRNSINFGEALRPADVPTSSAFPLPPQCSFPRPQRDTSSVPGNTASSTAPQSSTFPLPPSTVYHRAIPTTSFQPPLPNTAPNFPPPPPLPSAMNVPLVTQSTQPTPSQIREETWSSIVQQPPSGLTQPVPFVRQGMSNLSVNTDPPPQPVFRAPASTADSSVPPRESNVFSQYAERREEVRDDRRDDRRREGREVELPKIKGVGTKLTRETQYTLWYDKIVRELTIHSLSWALFSNVTPLDLSPDEAERRRNYVLQFIIRNCDDEHHRLIAGVKTPYEAISILGGARKPCGKTILNSLQTKFNNIRMDPKSETILGFQARFRQLVEDLKANGYMPQYAEVMHNLISAIHDSHPKVVTRYEAIDRYLSVEEVFAMMSEEEKVIEEVKRRDASGHAHFAEDKGESDAVYYVNRDKAVARSSSVGSRDSNRGRRREQSRSSNKSDDYTSVKPKNMNLRQVTCYGCGLNGHYQVDCRNKGKWCYGCRQFGNHIEANCPEKHAAARETRDGSKSPRKRESKERPRTREPSKKALPKGKSLSGVKARRVNKVNKLRRLKNKAYYTYREDDDATHWNATDERLVYLNDSDMVEFEEDEKEVNAMDESQLDAALLAEERCESPDSSPK